MAFFKGIYYQTAGSPTSPPLIFLHGFMGSGQDWEEIIPAFESQFYCITIDLPGHGKSLSPDSEEAYSFPGLSGLLVTLFDALMLNPVNLVGYSLGGRVALHLAVNNPERIGRVFLESASPGISHPTERKERLNRDIALADKLQTENFSQFLTEWYDQPLFRSLKENRRFPQLLQRRMRNSPEALGRVLVNLSPGVMPSLWEKLKKIPFPLRMIVGERDEKYVAIAKRMVRENPQIQIRVVPECGHNIHFENPEMFEKLLKAFLKNY